MWELAVTKVGAHFCFDPGADSFIQSFYFHKGANSVYVFFVFFKSPEQRLHGVGNGISCLKNTYTVFMCIYYSLHPSTKYNRNEAEFMIPFTAGELTIPPEFILVRLDIDPARVIDWAQKINYMTHRLSHVLLCLC